VSRLARVFEMRRGSLSPRRIGRVLQSFLGQTSPHDLNTLFSIVVVVAGAACVEPARRATRLDPLTTIRQDR
jgi:ABC-type lipoprotein release transport system permease subunit